MKKFIYQTCIFLIPYLAVFLIIAMVDPFEYFGKNVTIQTAKKEKISKKINYALWKVIEFKKNPSKNIILGDSRTNLIDMDDVQKITNKDYYNFSYGGGTLNEICSTFWYAANTAKLENVYIGISFNIYNKSKAYDRVKDALAIIENPILYLVNRDVFTSTYMLIKTKLQEQAINIEKPTMTKEKFWQYQLDVSVRKEYINYGYPEIMKKELLKIVNYCNENSINLFFIIMPSHQDLRQKIKEYGLEEKYTRFKSDLSIMGIVYDFDKINQYNGEKKNFRDPYHITKEYAKMIVNEIWNNERDINDIRSVEKSNKL